jgi:hypothetical protein
MHLPRLLLIYIGELQLVLYVFESLVGIVLGLRNRNNFNFFRIYFFPHLLLFFFQSGSCSIRHFFLLWHWRLRFHAARFQFCLQEFGRWGGNFFNNFFLLNLLEWCSGWLFLNLCGKLFNKAQFWFFFYRSRFHRFDIFFL